MSGKVFEELTELKSMIKEQQEIIKAWGQTNSQSDPGAMIELRATRKTLAASITLLATLEKKYKTLLRSEKAATEPST
jgi:hypothetical protein